MDGIEKAYKMWALHWPVPETTHGPSFRAGWLAARKRAVEVCKEYAAACADGSDAHVVASRLAAALERLGADEPEAEEG